MNIEMINIWYKHLKALRMKAELLWSLPQVHKDRVRVLLAIRRINKLLN